MLKMNVFYSLLMLIFFISSPVVRAETPLDQQLKSYLSQIKKLQTDFKQISYDRQGRPAETSTGKFYLSRPGRFRWDYQKPYIQEIVAKDNQVWFYDADLEQVTIKNLDDSLGATPALLLTGDIDVDKTFQQLDIGIEGDIHWLKLTPRDENSGFKYVLMGMKIGQLAAMELNDNFGQLTRIYFENTKINPDDINDEIFTFIIPEGVDVFGP